MLAQLLACCAILHAPDRYHLSRGLGVYGLEPRWVLAVAQAETGANASPRVRAHGCRGRNCAVGRFQILPSTARQRCPGFNIYEYHDNVACFLWMFSRDVIEGGVPLALRRQNPDPEYAVRALAVMEILHERGVP